MNLGKSLPAKPAASKKSSNTAKVRLQISNLGSKDEAERRKAHALIIAMRKSAVRPLVAALSSPNDNIRAEAVKILDEMEVNWSDCADTGTINALTADLASKDGKVRVRARQALVMIGEQSVPAIEKALASKEKWQRWEAAKTLGQIGGRSAAEALTRALDDEMFDVRWLAAQGLINIGRPAMVPLLQVLIKKPESYWVQEGVHHVLHDISDVNLRKILRPVLDALEDPEALEAPLAAHAAIQELAPGIEK